MFFFRSGDFNLPGSSLKSTSDICLRRLLPKRTTAFHRLSGVPGRAAILSTACLLALAASAMQAQQSNGLTFYHLAGPATTDAGGNTITSIKPGPQTDGVHVAFESGSATTACDSAASLYTVPITGGSVATLMGPSLRAESAEPAGTSTVLCSHLVLSGSTLFYPADYTPTGGSLRSGIFKLPIAGGASADVLATGDMTPLENFQTSGGTRVTQPGTVNSVATTTFSADPSANLIANYTASFTAGAPTASTPLTCMAILLCLAVPDFPPSLPVPV